MLEASGPYFVVTQDEGSLAKLVVPPSLETERQGGGIAIREVEAVPRRSEPAPLEVGVGDSRGK